MLCESKLLSQCYIALPSPKSLQYRNTATPQHRRPHLSHPELPFLCGVHILPYPRGPAGIKRSAYLLARDTVLSLPKPFQCRPPHLSCINCGAAIAMRLTKLSLSTLSLPGPKACCVSSPLPIESTCSGRDVQLLLPFQNLCDSTRRVLPVWVAKLPFHHAIQSCRQPVPTFAIEGFH